MEKFNTDTLSLFHTFSKTQVNSDANKPQFSSLGNTVNKSGHTVQSNEIWTEAIPFFGLGVPADFSSTAQVNDLVKDADGVIWQRNATPYSDANGTYWTQKTKSITSFTKGADGKYTFTEVDGALVDGSYLLNAAGVPTVKYHAKKQLTPLVSDNNAFIDSEKDASRLKINGKWVDQFIGVTDVYVNGSAAVSYAPVLFSTSTATSPLKAGAGEDYLDYCATGIILWDKNDCTGNEVISCFEYVGAKLDATVAKLSAAVFGSGGGSSEQPTDLVTQVNINTAAIATLNGDANTTGSVANTIKSSIADTTSANAIGKAIEDAKNAAIAGSTVTLTADTTEGNTGITIDPNGEPSNAFTVGIDQSIIATVASVTAISNIITDNKEEIDGKISTINGILEGLTSGDNSISAQISTAISNATSKVDIVNSDTSTGLVTAAQVSKYVGGEISAIDTGVTSISFNGGQAQKGVVSINALTEAMGSARQNGSISSESVALEKEDNAVYLTIANAEASVSEDQIVYGTESNYVATADDADVIATFRANKAKESLANTAITGDNLSVSGAGISVTLGGKVGTPTLTGSVTTASYTPASGETAASWTNKTYIVTGATVEAFVGAETTKTLDAAKAYSDSLHSTNLVYVVLGDNETLPDASADTVGKIYLVKEGNTANGETNIDAISGSYVEYMTRKVSETEYTWEKIGTTATDLSGYAKSVMLNGQSKSASANQIDLGTVVTGLYNSLASGTTNDSDQPNEKSIYAGIHNGGLHIGVASATSSVMGVSKMFTGELSTAVSEVEDTAVSVKSAQSMYGSLATLANSKVREVFAEAYLNLAGLTVTKLADNRVKIDAVSIRTSDANLGSNQTVINGLIDKNKVIDTTLIAFDSQEPAAEFAYDARSSLTTWVGDMPNLECGRYMFRACGVLTSFCGDLSNMTEGVGMFMECSKLESFCGDLSSLTSGEDMFYGCTLDTESLECIAETLPTVSGSPTIDIGSDTNVTDEIKATIRGKGWDLMSNGTTL